VAKNPISRSLIFRWFDALLSSAAVVAQSLGVTGSIDAVGWASR
jgi:hypothetical protein